MGAVHITPENFETEILNAKTPALVDFFAEWCGPCKMMGPIIEQMAEEYSGKIKVGKINVDDSQELAARFNVMSIPTLIIFKGGEAVDQVIGAVNKNHLVDLVKRYL